MKSYIKKNKFLFILSVMLLISIFLILGFVFCQAMNEKYYMSLKSISELSEGLKNKTYDFWRYVYDSGKAVGIQNNISRMSDIDNKKNAFLTYIKDFFDISVKENETASTTISSTSTTTQTSPNADLINNFYYFNLFLQLSVFSFTSLCIIGFFSGCIIFHLLTKYIFIEKIFNFYKLWFVLLLNVFGFYCIFNWEKKLFETRDPLLEKRSKMLVNSKILHTFWELKNRYSSFTIGDNENLIVVENLSFKPNIKHSIFKHFLDIYKFLKFKTDVVEKEHLYEQKSLFKSRSDDYILKDINLNIKKNSFNIIIGPNGAGKTTFIKSLLNLNENFLGNILWNGVELSKLNKKDFARHVSYIPQFMNIGYEISVFDFLMLTRMPYMDMYDNTSQQDEAIVLKAIKDSGCIKFADKKISELSGGQQQKVLLASILTQQSEIIVLDEPTVFLDIKNQNFLLHSLKQFHAKGKTIIMILHDLHQAINYATNLIVMKDGGIYSTGVPREIVNSKLLSEVFEIDCTITEKEGQFELSNIFAING